MNAMPDTNLSKRIILTGNDTYIHIAAGHAHSPAPPKKMDGCGREKALVS